MDDTFPTRRNTRLYSEYLPTPALTPMPGAPRTHPRSQIRALIKSFEAFGQVLPILIDAEDRIISGHAQYEVAKRIGLAEVMAIRIEYLSEHQSKGLMVALNRLSDLSKWDEQALCTILVDLQGIELDFDIEATGFTEIEIELRIDDLEFDGPGADEEPLVASGPAITKPGDLFQLGDHLLLCASSLEETAWTQLMGEDRAAIVVTDPL